MRSAHASCARYFFNGLIRFISSACGCKSNHVPASIVIENGVLMKVELRWINRINAAINLTSFTQLTVVYTTPKTQSIIKRQIISLLPL